jgi:antitoxin Phd
MKEIQLKDAKATLSHVLDDAVAGKPAIITRHGKREGVLLSYAEYEKLSRKPSLGWLLANSPLDAADLHVRKPARALRKSGS